MTSRGAAGRLWSQASTFYEEGNRNWCPVKIKALIMVETI
jgi:hypothetical protein